MKALKFLAAGSVGRFSDTVWPLPDPDAPGAWVEAAGPLEVCRCGVHACDREELLDWIDDELWEIELDRAVRGAETGVIAGRGRLLRRLERWDEGAAAAFAAACAARVRTHAVIVLRRDGHVDEARTLAAASLPAARAVSAAALDDSVAEAAGFVADCLLLARGARPDEPDAARVGAPVPAAAAVAANLAFVSAHAAGRLRGRHDERAYAVAFARERDWQLRFLCRLIGL